MRFLSDECVRQYDNVASVFRVLDLLLFAAAWLSNVKHIITNENTADELISLSNKNRLIHFFNVYLISILLDKTKYDVYVYARARTSDIKFSLNGIYFSF